MALEDLKTAAWLLAAVELTDKRDNEVSKKKKFIEEGYKLADKISEKTKKRMRAGKLKLKSNDPDVQKMIDEVIGKPTKIGVVTTEKGVPIIKDARGTHGSVGLQVTFNTQGVANLCGFRHKLR